MKKNIAIGVTGGIACYKAAEVVNALVKKGMEVRVIMTKNATEFITPLTFQTLSRNKVVVDMFSKVDKWDTEHISIAKRTDLFAIVPATANFIGKLANGIADDMLLTTLMATRSPVMIAPAMNTVMWENPIVQDNIVKLKKYNYQILETGSGRLACGDEGEGKLLDWEIIVQRIMAEAK